jgi:phage baseplate assembly protein W
MATPQNATFAFPFAVTNTGRITASGGDDAIRGKIIQVLFTTPGERVHVPDFGCGLFNLVFEPNDPILAATMEFTVGQALSRWLEDEIVVEGVNVEADEEMATIQVAYTKRQDLSQQAVQIHFR